MKSKRKNELVEERTITFKLKEGGGQLPYAMVYISRIGLPSAEHFATLEEAQKASDNFIDFGYRTSILIDARQCEIIPKKGSK